MSVRINNLKSMLETIKKRLDDQQNLGASYCSSFKNTQKLREQEKRELDCWAGRCPNCKTFNEVETDDIKFESGFFGTPIGHYTKCLDCGYNDVPVKFKN